LYVFNIMDAVRSSGRFYSTTHKNPVAAAWLSAIPCLALGQMYNGAISKAGMIWMTQTMLLDMAFNYNRLRIDCIQAQQAFADSTNWRCAYRNDATGRYQEQWEGKYGDAFMRRNLYLWYAVFFYFYQVFDAAVDAHLHDYQRKIRMEPAYDVDSERIGLSFYALF